MIITVLKTTFKKCKRKVISYRSYKNFDDNAFNRDLWDQVLNWGNYTELAQGTLEVLNMHATKKKMIVQANEVPYLTKALRKAISDRSRLVHQYYKRKSKENLTAYKKQKNFCSRLLS